MNTSGQGAFPYYKLHLSFEIIGGFSSEYNFSSAFRGLFGRALKHSFCIQKNLDCNACSITECLYKRIFEDSQSGHEQYRPYVMYHKTSFENMVLLDYLLFGEAVQHISSILHAIFNIPNRQIMLGKTLHELTLFSITDHKGYRIYDHDSGAVDIPPPSTAYFVPDPRENLELLFVSPLRMKHDGHLMSSFIYSAFLRSLYSRLVFLDNRYNSGALSVPSLWDDPATLSSRMYWKEQPRKSFRQAQTMSIGGLIGSVYIENPHPLSCALLDIGQIIGAGKQCSFGQGRYKIR